MSTQAVHSRAVKSLTHVHLRRHQVIVGIQIANR